MESSVRSVLQTKKSRIRETPNLSTDADSITIAMKREKKKINLGIIFFFWAFMTHQSELLHCKNTDTDYYKTVEM